jgi:hypothetical protein
VRSRRGHVSAALSLPHYRLRFQCKVYLNCGRDAGYPATPAQIPAGRDSRTGFPPWVIGGEAVLRPRMDDAGRGEPSVSDSDHTVPR